MARMIASRAVNHTPPWMREEYETTDFVELADKPRETDEQGIGKSPGFRMPFRRFFASLVDPQLKQKAPGATEKGLQVPLGRPEKHGWTGGYLLFYEQQTRHAWPGGGGGSTGHVIERPESVPLVSLAPQL